MTWPAFGPIPTRWSERTCGPVTPSTPGPKIRTLPSLKGDQVENDYRAIAAVAAGSALLAGVGCAGRGERVAGDCVAGRVNFTVRSSLRRSLGKYSRSKSSGSYWVQVSRIDFE